MRGPHGNKKTGDTSSHKTDPQRGNPECFALAPIYCSINEHWARKYQNGSCATYLVHKNAPQCRVRQAANTCVLCDCCQLTTCAQRYHDTTNALLAGIYKWSLVLSIHTTIHKNSYIPLHHYKSIGRTSRLRKDKYIEVRTLAGRGCLA